MKPVRMRCLPDVLMRAPLLPARAGDPESLLAHPLGRAAVALASPDLAAALGGRRVPVATRAALGRYAARAAHRPTPAGLLAGVTLGRLGARTQVDTGRAAARAHWEPTWARLRGLARALLDDPALRRSLDVRVRLAPSTTIRGEVVTWLAFNGPDGALALEGAPLDETLEALLAAAETWTPWAQVHEVLREASADAEPEDAQAGEDEDAAWDANVDDLLLLLIDRGLLHHDLEPPLIGPAPRAALGTRVMARVPELAPLWHELEAALERQDGEAARVALQKLPGSEAADGGRAVTAVLEHQPRKVPTLAQAAVERAAAIAPALWGLQQALHPPVRERALDARLQRTLDALVELYGAGAYDAGGLLAGDYGLPTASEDGAAEPEAPGPDEHVLVLLAEGVLEAAREQRDELVLEARFFAQRGAHPDAADPGVAAGGPPLPSTFELLLTPAREPRGAPAGTGWMIGLHGPAGASWGRFAHTLGAPLEAALAAVAAAETEARPTREAVDVAVAASPALADLSVHPPVRRRALALAGFPAEGAPLLFDDVEVVHDPAVRRAPALRDRGHRPLSVRPLHRVRSTTAPAGLPQLVCGDSFLRQHAPWAFTWGPLAALPALPRVVMDGFVIAPRRFRVPDAATLSARGGLARWRRRYRVPDVLQVLAVSGGVAGAGDELLPVDLRAPGAAARLAKHAGQPAHEVWPPPARLCDAGGRRVEAVVAVVVDPAPDSELRQLWSAQDAAVAEAGVVPSPRKQPPSAAWRTFKIFGLPERQDEVLLRAVAPVVTQASLAKSLDGFFFLRYVDEPGARAHLRVRLQARSASKLDAAERRLRRSLQPLRAAGAVVSLETTEYFPETARYGGPAALADIERVFALDSGFVLSVLGTDADGESEGVDRLELLVRACDATATGLGLDAPERAALAESRWRAHVGLAPELAERLGGEHRQRKAALFAALGPGHHDAYSAALEDHARGLARFIGEIGAPRAAAVRARLAPLLHLGANRLVGTDATVEGLAYGLWARTLTGLRARARSGAR